MKRRSNLPPDVTRPGVVRVVLVETEGTACLQALDTLLTRGLQRKRRTA